MKITQVIKINRIRSYKILISITLFGIAVFIIFLGFTNFPIENTSLAIDWKSIWNGIRGGKLNYNTGLRNPPWSLLPILPLGLLSFRSSWATISILTAIVLVASVPRNTNRWFLLFGSLVLVTSFPSLRHFADGNLEALVIAGIMISLFGYYSENPIMLCIGILLCSAKPQASWLFLLAIGIYTLNRWPIRKVLYCLVLLIIVISLAFFYAGIPWLQAIIGIEQRGSIMDASLSATMNRLGIPYWIILISWITIFLFTLYLLFVTSNSFSRIKAGFVIAASLLLAPYAAGNSLLTVIAISVLPLFLISPPAGVLIIVIINLQYLFPTTFHFYWGAIFATSMFLLNWIVLGLFLYRSDPDDASVEATRVTP